jgi:hypothetical protein
MLLLESINGCHPSLKGVQKSWRVDKPTFFRPPSLNQYMSISTFTTSTYSCMQYSGYPPSGLHPQSLYPNHPFPIRTPMCTDSDWAQQLLPLTDFAMNQDLDPSLQHIIDGVSGQHNQSKLQQPYGFPAAEAQPAQWSFAPAPRHLVPDPMLLNENGRSLCIVITRSPQY